MADRVEPPVSEALMALLAGAAPLFERAKAAGLFRSAPINATPSSSTSSAAASSEAPADAQKAALQEIIVAQAMKIVALEAEVKKLKG